VFMYIFHSGYGDFFVGRPSKKAINIVFLDGCLCLLIPHSQPY
ncbi:MAG: hypothetical protein ACI8QY_000450, partial [bacterium]